MKRLQQMLDELRAGENLHEDGVASEAVGSWMAQLAGSDLFILRQFLHFAASLFGLEANAHRKIGNDPCPRGNGARCWIHPGYGIVLNSLAWSTTVKVNGRSRNARTSLVAFSLHGGSEPKLSIAALATNRCEGHKLDVAIGTNDPNQALMTKVDAAM